MQPTVTRPCEINKLHFLIFFHAKILANFLTQNERGVGENLIFGCKKGLCDTLTEPINKRSQPRMTRGSMSPDLEKGQGRQAAQKWVKK